MKSFLLLALAAQAPFTGTSPGWFSGRPVPAVISPAAVPLDLQAQAAEERLRQLLANTKSVMKRRGEVSSSGRAADNTAPALRDDQILQTAFNQPQKNATKGGTGDSPPTERADAETSPPAGSPTANGSVRSESSIDDTTRAAANLSAKLLASAPTPPAENALDGRPVSLAEALGRVPNSSQRLEVASLYWRLALALADYHWALDESLQLALPPYEDAVGSPLLAAAQASAQARVLEAKAAAVTAQQELADAIGQPTQPLPLTIEQPLVGPYRTEFESIFANRAAPGRARAIHRALPHWREAIDLRTAAIQAAASAVKPAEKEAYAPDGKGGIETVLYVHRELAQQRRAFLNAVREYNAEIVEYASYVAGPTTSTATIVSMLTRTKPEKTSGVSPPSSFAASNEPTMAPPEDSQVRPVAGEEPMGEVQGQESDWSPAQQPM
ncbi:MAG: hypothetical protein WD894_24105 [Pirellulales bacterium]